MTAKLSLTIPQAPDGGSDAPDFSTLEIGSAGAQRCPPLDAKARDILDMADDLVRVLDFEDNAQGPWRDFLGDVASDDVLLRGLRDMMRMRAVDERLLKAQRQGKTPFYLQLTGEEAIGCGFQRMLRKGDMNFPTYRQQSLLVGADYPLVSLMGQIYANEKDPTKGRQLPTMHSARDYGFFSISGNLGTQFVQSVGWAAASALTGDDKIAVGWIGDGASASNDFHSALLYASVYKPPVVLNIVNNQWAISTHQNTAGGGEVTFATRGHGYGIPALRVDGNDYLAVLAVSKWAIDRARNNMGPTLIEWVTYRVASHSTSDDPSAYRSVEASANWPLGDPIKRLKQHLVVRGAWSEERHVQAEAEIMSEVIDAQKEAESFGTFLDRRPFSPSDIFKHVYADMPEHLVRQRQEMGY